MAVVICCPCGTPIDYENLDLVVTLSCPKCSRELELEIEQGPADRRRGLLTVVEGPHWVGERFLVPVGVELKIGNTSGNWICLDSEQVAPYHCRMLLSPQGAVVVEDAKSPTGTWIGQQRIARGRLGPSQSFRVGEFRFRLDFQNSDGTTVVAAPSPVLDRSGVLPTMVKVTPKPTLGNKLASHRFRLARWLLLAAAVSLGVFHLVGLQGVTESWHWARAAAVGLGVGLLTAATGRKVTLAHRYFRYGPIALMIALSIADMVWALPAGIVATLGIAASLGMMIVANPATALVACGAGLGLVSVIIVGIAAIRGVLGLAG